MKSLKHLMEQNERLTIMLEEKQEKEREERIRNILKSNIPDDYRARTFLSNEETEAIARRNAIADARMNGSKDGRGRVYRGIPASNPILRKQVLENFRTGETPYIRLTTRIMGRYKPSLEHLSPIYAAAYKEAYDAEMGTIREERKVEKKVKRPLFVHDPAIHGYNKRNR